MAHPSIEEIVAGTADAHLARCEACRKLAQLAGIAVEPPPAADDLDGIGHVDERLYTEWTPLADARGGMGQIFRARDRRLGRYVAIKQLRAEGGEGGEGARPGLVRRFEREAKLTARLQHPAIVGVYEAGRFSDGEPFYAMPHLRGASLTAEIGKRKTLADRLGLLPNLTTIAEAVAYAHDEGIIHRDIKPDNILVGTFGETVLIDWGLAKDTSDATGEPEGAYRSVATDGLTQLGVGTAHYMPPEQARGEEPDLRADIYALGATLYHTLAGIPPYGDDRSTDVRRAHADAKPPRPLLEVEPDVPRELADIVEHAMARERAARYASARELADELRRYQTGQLLTSRRYSLGELIRHFARRYRTALRISAVAAVVLIAVAIVAVVRIARERDRAEANQARAERELRRAQGIVASRIAADPVQRLDAILLGIRAVGPDLHAGLAPVPEAAQGLLDALSAGPPLVPLRHEGVIKFFARAGDKLLGVDDARALQIWDARSGATVARYPSALPQPERPIVSPDGKRVVVCGFDPIGEVFELATGAHKTFDAKANFEGCAFLPDGRLITAADEVVVRDPVTLAVVERFPLSGNALGMTVSAAGRVAVVTLGGVLWLWSPGAVPQVSATKLALGAAMTFDREARVLYDCGGDQVLRAFATDVPVALPTAVFQEPSSHLASVAISPDGAELAVGMFDLDNTRHSIVFDRAGKHPPADAPGMFEAWTARSWAVVDRLGPIDLVDPASGGRVLELDAHAAETSVRVDGDRLASGSRDGAAFLWDLTGGMAGGMLLGHTAEIVTVSARGDEVLTASHDGSARIWRGPAGAPAVVIGGDSELVAASWLGDHAVVLADLAGTVRVVDAASGRELAGMTGTAPVGALAVSRDASHVALGGLDGRLEVRDAMLARPVVLAAPGASAVTAVAFAPDGTRVVSGHADGSTRLWDSTTGAQVAIRPDPELVDEPTDHEGHAALAFTPDGARILAVRPAGKTLVLAATDLATRATLDGRMVGELAPDGHHLAAALGDGAILVHDLDGGAPLRLTGERGIVVTAAFSADGGRLVAGAIDGSVRVWSVAGTPPAATPIAPVATIAATGLGSATALAVTGDAIVAGYASGAVRVHPANPLAALARACAVAARFGRERETSPYCSGWAASERR